MTTTTSISAKDTAQRGSKVRFGVLNGQSVYLNEADVTVFEAGIGSRPHVQIGDDRCVLHARLRRCFPLTAAAEFVGVFDADWKEVGIVKDVSRLDDRSRRAVEAELDSFYFTPAIRTIVSLKQEASMWRWKVTTQRGPAEFYLRGVRDSVHEVAPGRWQIYSVDGQRYEIQDIDELDQRSQSLFESLF